MYYLYKTSSLPVLSAMPFSVAKAIQTALAPFAVSNQLEGNKNNVKE
jgi:hypothetical protein